MVKGLRIMHQHGYVHRDVSTGNIISHDGHGKMADLKYAKKIGTGGAHEVRTVWLSSHNRNTRSTRITIGHYLFHRARSRIAKIYVHSTPE